MAKAGRPPGITDAQTAAIVVAIKAGAYVETAIVAAGVKKSTFYGWLKRAAEDEEKHRKSVYMKFADEIRLALATAELELLRKVADGGAYWARYAWMLERRFRDRWAIPKGESGPRAA